MIGNMIIGEILSDYQIVKNNDTNIQRSSWALLCFENYVYTRLKLQYRSRLKHYQN
jgi:hypothetical protein